MMLCAVLRAIFRPAALVADGCFRFGVVEEAPPFVPEFVADTAAEGGGL
jgi:hypothetical protein